MLPPSSIVDSQLQRIKSILSSAREEHTKTVSSRIEAVQQLSGVVPLTEQLYAVAKETNALEHSNFLLAQENAVKSELKAVLDSWVRFEQQQREAEQKDLVKSVMESVESELGKPAFKRNLLEEALGQVERECFGWG
jgi:F-type H+-transporting ATPase subunit b